MFVVIIYDVEVQRIDGVRTILKQYLSWIQNSAFEGEITEGKLEELRLKLVSIIDKTKDYVIVYSVNNPRWLQKRVWGVEKNTTENII